MVFLFDENIPYKLAQGFMLIEEADKSPKIRATVTHIKILDKEGITDEEVIELAGKMDAIIVTFDRDFRHIKSYYPLYKKHNVGIVLLKLDKKDSNYWGIVRILTNNWEKIKEKLHKERKPFVYEVDSKGVHRREF
jgi:predicted nuclease of predicted toxin-antitoxin system